jgi:hypothetical protein
VPPSTAWEVLTELRAAMGERPKLSENGSKAGKASQPTEVAASDATAAAAAQPPAAQTPAGWLSNTRDAVERLVKEAQRLQSGAARPGEGAAPQCLAGLLGPASEVQGCGAGVRPRPRAGPARRPPVAASALTPPPQRPCRWGDSP